MEEMVEIPKSEYLKLVADQDFLNCLRAAGVDNWSGYDYACEAYEELNGDA